jgi:F-type H+-transporting ATPase subunit b
MIKILLTFFMVSVYAFASGDGGEGSTDIVQRTVNFLIFAGILYYLLAEPIKNYFTGRSDAIVQELERVKEKLKDSKAAKEKALLKIEEANKFAAALLESSKKENKILNDTIMRQCDNDIENIEKQSRALMELEQRKMVRGVVENIMADVLSHENDGFDKDAMAQLILKKVA